MRPKLSTAIILMIVILFSCQKEASKISISEEEFSAAAAKEWYYGTFKKTVDYAAFNATTSGKKLPEWKISTKKKVGEYSVVDFPLAKQKSSVFFSQSTNLSENNKKRIAESSITKMSFIKSKNGKVDVRETTYIPDIDYLIRHNYDISSNSFGNIDDDYSGSIVVKTWNGKEISRTILSNGKITKHLNSVNSNIRNRIAEQYCAIEWARDCELHISGDIVTYTCGEWYQTGNNFCWYEEEVNEDPCFEDPESPMCSLCVMFGLCEDPAGGGDDPPPCTSQNADDLLSTLVSSGIELNTKEDIETISATSSSITRSYKWKIFATSSAIETITMHSKETGIQEYDAGGFWKWTSFGHDLIYHTGSATLWDLNLDALTDQTPTIINISMPTVPVTYSIAGIRLQGTMKITVNCGVFVRNSYPDFDVTNSWYTFEQ